MVSSNCFFTGFDKDIRIDGIAVNAKTAARATRSNPVETKTIQPVLYFIGKGSNDQS
ncbi:Hypothetical protein P9303_16101 [Prochlorococcus marinus str. MIT 9303]|uniref:Uncharacterized protein n=1 Tax=Prochlorococcus marinus (strain MIT 9303) TaxID=59922 RepID=A2CA44_PROM3|nr:Hypothetical protein P9303_16101 [Prochlorococcus marinus str. MIT 9303]